MADYLFHSVYAWIGLGGVTIVILGVIAYFIPGFRLLAIEIAGAILAATAIYAKGAKDQKGQDQAKQKRVEDAAIAKGKSDRAAAERDASRGVRDGYDRDQ